MPYQIKIGKNIQTQDIDIFYPMIGFGVYEKKDWDKVIKTSTFIVQILFNNKTIGFGRVVDDGTFAMIYDIAVHPDFQRQGIGTLVMTEIKKYVSQNDFFSVSLFYNPDNQDSKKFYEKCGFYSLPNAMRLKK